MEHLSGRARHAQKEAEVVIEDQIGAGREVLLIWGRAPTQRQCIIGIIEEFFARSRMIGVPFLHFRGDLMRRISVVEAMRAAASISVALFHFCIPLSLYGRGYALRAFPSFLFRRLLRLEPAYLVSISIVLILWYASSLAPGFAGQAPHYSFPQLASHLFYIVPLTSYQWMSPVYWSLAYEFIFYITVGLTFSYLIIRNVALTVALALGALVLSFAVYGAFDARIVEFLIGALLMRSAVSSAKDIQIGMCLLASLVIVFLIAGIATGIVVCLAACAIFFLRSVECGPWTAFLGSLSYSLYLIHVPIGGRVVNLAKRFGEGPVYEFAIVVAALVASLIVAMLLHRFVEVPAMKASRKIGRQAVPAA